MVKRKTTQVMSLREAVAAAKPTKTAVVGTGGFSKTPAGYNRKANQCIQDMINHEDPVVRIAVLSSTRCPSTKLRASLESEKESQVLRAILMNPQLTVKAIVTFCEGPRCAQFDEDKELETHLIARITAAASA